MRKCSSSEADLKVLLVFVVISGLFLSGTAMMSAVNLTTLETRSFTQNLMSWR